MEGLDEVGFPLESPKLALFHRKGGFLFSEHWLAQNGTVAFFERTTHHQRLLAEYGRKRMSDERLGWTLFRRRE